jgi:translocation and assembly module TamA
MNFYLMLIGTGAPYRFQSTHCKQHKENAGRGPSLSNRLRQFFVALLMAALLYPFFVHAQTVRYTVEINGAGPFAPLLNDNLEIRRHEDDPNLSQEELQRLVASTPQQIQELLATEGYFSVTVDYTLTQEAGRWVARFNVKPGEPVRINSIDIRFTGEIAQGPHANPQRIERLRRQWSLKPGEIFRQSEWNNAKSNLLKGLLNRDFPAAKIVQSEALIDPNRHTAALTVDVDSGPLFTFGPLEIQGLKRYSQEIIDRLNPIHPGEPFAQEKLTELQSRLQDSGYFRTVFATINVDPSHPSNVPVHLDLVENERHRLSLGIGFSTDSGARAQVKWLDRSFLGHDWRLESALRYDRTTPLLRTDLYFPAHDNGWSPSLGAHYERTNISNEINDRVRLDARMTGPVKADEEVWGLSFLAEKQHIGDLPPNTRHAFVGTYTYTRRRVDNLLSPRRGYVASVELNGGLRGIGNESNIGRVLGRVNWLSPTMQRWQVVARAQLGQVVGASRETVPSELLFRTGGDQTVRGYAFETLGVPQAGAIVGGRVLAVASAELVYHITPAWGAAIFRDAGNAADSWGGFHFAQGTGIGARWRSPIGPVNVDLAYGHDTRKPRLHFSLGYGF